MQEGKIQPKVAMRAPGIPAILIPTKVAEFTAIGPGVISAIVIKSVNSTHGQPTVRGHYLILYEGHCSVTATDTKLPTCKKLKNNVNRS